MQSTTPQKKSTPRRTKSGSRAKAGTSLVTAPWQQLITMIVITLLVMAGAVLVHAKLIELVRANLFLNGLIALAFVVGIASCFWRINSLFRARKWLGAATSEQQALDAPAEKTVLPPRATEEDETPANPVKRPPQLVSSVSKLMKSLNGSGEISPMSMQSILDSVATRLDEASDITRYTINLLIFLGLLGTFYGLATTVPAVVDTIRALAPVKGETSADVFARLMTGLERQLGGMGTAFSSSLLGLASSLVVGLLDLFTGHGQNRFYRELEEWLIEKTGFGAPASSKDGILPVIDLKGDGKGAEALARVIAVMSANIERLNATLSRQTPETEIATLRSLETLGGTLAELNAKLPDAEIGERTRNDIAEQNALLKEIASGQEQILGASRLAAQQETLQQQLQMLGAIHQSQEEVKSIARDGSGELARMQHEANALLAQVAESQARLLQFVQDQEAPQAEPAQDPQIPLLEKIAGQQDRLIEVIVSQADETNQQQEAHRQLLMQIANWQQEQLRILTHQIEEGADPEMRMHIRKIDGHLMRLLEDLAAGRQDTVAEIRAEMIEITKAIKGLGRRGPTRPGREG
ncbi:MAG: hypothetical protein Q9M41_04865 [Paracoccaceae bacterium]|nr:hypothetical protein [Paracoccaceae bacterium]